MQTSCREENLLSNVECWQEFSGGTAARDGDGRGYEEIAAGREAAAA